jgi:hypothetical protein
MDDEIILIDDLTPDGLRRLHVMQMGEPVKVENWITRVPMASIHTCHSTDWVEKEIGMHHLLLFWKPREMVALRHPSTSSGREAQETPVEVVMWWIDVKAGDTIRKCADDAACLFSLLHTWLPTKAAVRKLPTSAKGKKLDEPFQDVQFIEEPWVPKDCVAVW